MRKVLDVDKALCVGCRLCEMACSLNRTGVFSLSKSAIQIIVDDHEGTYTVVVCRQCKNAPCVKACHISVEAGKPIIRDEKTGIVRITSNEQCIGCYECVRACPFGAIHIGPEDDKLVMCDLCDGQPECVRWCPPPGAIRFIPISMMGVSKAVTSVKKGA